MNLHCISFGTVLLAICQIVDCQVCSDPVCDLMQNLTRTYNKDVIPRCNDNSSVQVEIQLVLRQVVDLIEPKQILSSNVWIRLIWEDCHLRWDPSKFSGTTSVYFPSDGIWTPDISLYDDSAFGSNVAMSERKFYKLEVTHDGVVKQKFPSVLSSVCSVDATDFPFDKQTCPLKFASWVYNDLEVNLTTKTDGDTTLFKENSEWVLKHVYGVNSLSYYDGQSFAEVLFTIEIQRRATFFMLTLFFPCALITIMTIIGFFLPPSSGQKVGLQLTLLLSLTVFEFLTLGLVPPNSKPLPLMCVYFALVMSLSAVSCMLTVVVLKIHNKGRQGWKVSPKIKSLLIDKLGKLLCVKRPHKYRKYLEDTQPQDGATNTSNGGVSELRLSNKSTANSNPEQSGCSKSLEEIIDRLGQMIQLLKKAKSTDESEEYHDWCIIATTLDRLFLILYFTLSVLVSLAFFIEIST